MVIDLSQNFDNHIEADNALIVGYDSRAGGITGMTLSIPSALVSSRSMIFSQLTHVMLSMYNVFFMIEDIYDLPILLVDSIPDTIACISFIYFYHNK
jgi:hypothetical protein